MRANLASAYYRVAYLGFLKEPVTNSLGWFSARLKVLVSAPWFAEYPGDATHFASASATVRVTAAGTTPVWPNLNTSAARRLLSPAAHAIPLAQR